MLDGRKIDLRVSTFPGSRGEKTVIRVLDTRNVSLNLVELGFTEEVLSESSLLTFQTVGKRLKWTVGIGFYRIGLP